MSCSLGSRLASVPYGMRLSQAIVPVTPTNGLASNAPDGLALKLSVELLGPEALAAKILLQLLLEKLRDDPPSKSLGTYSTMSCMCLRIGYYWLLSLQEE